MRGRQPCPYLPGSPESSEDSDSAGLALGVFTGDQSRQPEQGTENIERVPHLPKSDRVLQDLATSAPELRGLRRARNGLWFELMLAYKQHKQHTGTEGDCVRGHHDGHDPVTNPPMATEAPRKRNKRP
jgi:hypothetical protein